MALYPAFLNLKDRRCLVVGSGEFANRRIYNLQKSGAIVDHLTPAAAADHSTTGTTGTSGQTLRELFDDVQLSEYWLVIAATGEADFDRFVSNRCEEQRIFCNATTDPSMCSYIVPSVVDRSPLQIAIASAGESPVLSRVIKARLESLIPPGYSRLAATISRYQQRVRTVIKDRPGRARFWQNVVNGSVGELAFGSSRAKIEQRIEDLLARENNTEVVSPGTLVSLVGAGPGDPDLLTFRALRLIQSADVIVYDRLVSEQILDLAPEHTELIYAGKARSDHALPQESINALLVSLARDGRSVVRLKGGDPFIFGRGGEEIESLAASGLPFQVVPGITAASGCAAFSGIPLTHRDHAQSCVFVTGHLKNNDVNLNWSHLINPDQTVVVYMGLVGLPRICANLIDAGRDPATPAALIEQGTTPQQRVLKADLQTLPDVVATHDVKAPTLLIVGNVVTLHDTLNWFTPQ